MPSEINNIFIHTNIFMHLVDEGNTDEAEEDHAAVVTVVTGRSDSRRDLPPPPSPIVEKSPRYIPPHLISQHVVMDSSS